MLVNLINVLWILIIINIVHYQYHLATCIMNRCSKPSAVYSTIDYMMKQLVLHTDVLAASIAASHC